MSSEHQQVLKQHILHQGPHVQGGVACPACGAAISPDCELCPECGQRVVGYCTFCGANLPMDADECPECGISTRGIVCPECNKVSFRPFCPCCNAPLTRVAAKAVERALADPQFVEVQEYIHQIEQLEEEIQQTTPPDVQIPPAVSAEIEKKKEKVMSLERDINKLFEQMLPPAGSTPQQQRNFYSARKVQVKTLKKIKVEKRVGWICNLCSCRHSTPSECAMPELGGKWIYSSDTKTVETTTETTIKD